MQLSAPSEGPLPAMRVAADLQQHGRVAGLGRLPALQPVAEGDKVLAAQQLGQAVCQPCNGHRPRRAVGIGIRGPTLALCHRIAEEMLAHFRQRRPPGRLSLHIALLRGGRAQQSMVRLVGG